MSSSAVQRARRRASAPSSVGFAPVASPVSNVLILGTLPGQVSLARREYYAQPQNAFWRIMGDLFGAGLNLPYAERTARLLARQIAVWDVCASAKRAGSLDAKIEIGTIMANDFNGFFATHRQIGIIAMNGAMAERLFHRLVVPHLGAMAREIDRIRLPSTSPANASIGYAAKLAAWSVIRADGGHAR